MHRSLLLILTFGILYAQSVPTWGGLSFGMSQAQVRAVVGVRLLKAHPGADEQPVDKTLNLFSGGTVRETGIEGFAGDATLLFDNTSKKLSMVTLFLTAGGPSLEDRSSACTQLREDLFKKYGSPVRRTGCADGADECHLIFRSNGQTVNVRMTIVEQGYPTLVFISYAPVGADKRI